jgi:small-conductance mechanosensitive channel
LAALNDPARRAQIQDTLRAVAVAGALATPPAATPASAAAPGSAAVPSGASSSMLAASLTKNGLASQFSKEARHWVVQAARGLHRSVLALLDYGSAVQWWQEHTSSDAGRRLVAHAASAVATSVLPALVLQYLVARFLRGLKARIAARGVADANDKLPRLHEEEEAAVRAQADAARSGNDAVRQVAQHKSESVRGERHATRHWAFLQRLPRALLYMVINIVPLAVFVAVSTVTMSIAVTDGSPQASLVASLIEIYTICALIISVTRFFLAPTAPGLRLVQLPDGAASFAHTWILRIVCVSGAGAAIAETAAPYGLTDNAHDAIMKAVALIAHVMIAVMVLKCRKPVAGSIRQSFLRRPSFASVGNWIADIWAGVAVFFVLALWFVWALDLRNGYRTLFNLSGISILVLIGARVVAIIAFGALGRIFRAAAENDGSHSSIARRHAFRYYPLLRRILQTVIFVATVLTLLQVWGLHVLTFFSSSGIGHRLTSAVFTIAVAAAFAAVLWDGANVIVEQRLETWTTSGDHLRAARLRTLLPMMRSALFVVVAMVVAMTGLSEIGVNTAPLLASASIFGVALGFGSQKLVQDVITGIFLLMENAMQVGDWVTLAGVSGAVEYLSIRTVRLRGGDGSLYTVPFSSVSTVNNTNRGIGNASVRVSIALGADVDRAAATLNEIGVSLRQDPAFKDGILSDFSLWGVDALDGSSVTLAGQIQCTDSARWGVQREYNRRVHDRFTALGIEIANPQRNFVVIAGEAARSESAGLAAGVSADETSEQTAVSGSDNRRPRKSAATQRQSTSDQQNLAATAGPISDSDRR